MLTSKRYRLDRIEKHAAPPPREGNPLAELVEILDEMREIEKPILDAKYEALNDLERARWHRVPMVEIYEIYFADDPVIAEHRAAVRSILDLATCP